MSDYESRIVDDESPIQGMDVNERIVRLSKSDKVSLDWAKRITRIAETAVNAAETRNEVPAIASVFDRLRVYWSMDPRPTFLQEAIAHTIIDMAEERGMTVQTHERAADHGHGPYGAQSNVITQRLYVRVLEKPDGNVLPAVREHQSDGHGNLFVNVNPPLATAPDA